VQTSGANQLVPKKYKKPLVSQTFKLEINGLEVTLENCPFIIPP